MVLLNHNLYQYIFSIKFPKSRLMRKKTIIGINLKITRGFIGKQNIIDWCGKKHATYYGQSIRAERKKIWREYYTVLFLRTMLK